MGQHRRATAPRRRGRLRRRHLDARPATTGPAPREISNALVAHGEEDTPNDRQLSAFIYVWGQFLDHDIDLTEPPTTDREAFNIAVPDGDAFFDPDGTGTQVIRLNRSRFDADHRHRAPTIRASRSTRSPPGSTAR